MYWSRFCRELDGQYQFLVPLEALNNIFRASVCLPFKNLNISIHQISGLQFWQVLIGSCNSEYPLFWDGIQNGFSFHDNLTVYYCSTVVPTRHPLKTSIFLERKSRRVALFWGPLSLPFFDGPDWGDDLGEEKHRHGTVTAFPHLVRRSQIPYLRGENSAIET